MPPSAQRPTEGTHRVLLLSTRCLSPAVAAAVQIRGILSQFLSFCQAVFRILSDGFTQTPRWVYTVSRFVFQKTGNDQKGGVPCPQSTPSTAWVRFCWHWTRTPRWLTRKAFGLASAGMPPCWHRPVPRRADTPLFWPSWERTHSDTGPPLRSPPRAWIPHTRPFPAHCPPLCCLKPAARRSLTAEQLEPGLFQPGDALLFASSGLCDSPLRYTHLAALTAARDAGALTCFVPCLEPALWPQPEREAALREVTRQLLPRADIVILTTEELEFLFGTAEMRVALFPLLRGHTQLVLLARAEGIHAFTRTNHAFWPGLSLPAPRLAAKALCCLLQKNSTPEKLPRLTTRQLQTIL